MIRAALLGFVLHPNRAPMGAGVLTNAGLRDVTLSLFHPPDDLAQIVDATNQETTEPLREIGRKEIGYPADRRATAAHVSKVSSSIAMVQLLGVAIAHPNLPG